MNENDEIEAKSAEQRGAVDIFIIAALKLFLREICSRVKHYSNNEFKPDNKNRPNCPRQRRQTRSCQNLDFSAHKNKTKNRNKKNTE